MPPATGQRTQDLIFTLFGDYLAARGDDIWIGSLIEILGALGVSEQAVRSTVSRMARKGWLSSTKCGRNSFYSLTAKSSELIHRGARRIYDDPTSDWDGTWHLVAYSFSNGQERIRHRLRKELSWLGFGQLNNGTLISPHDHISEVRELVAALGATSSVDYFRADYKELYGANNLAMRCWSLDEINDYYCEFIEKYRPMYQRDLLAVDSRPPAYCFERRFWLTHQYRYFPFHDPYLPAQLLPDNWRGGEAVQLFRDYHSLLRNNAEAYVDQVLAGAPSKTGAI